MQEHGPTVVRIPYGALQTLMFKSDHGGIPPRHPLLVAISSFPQTIVQRSFLIRADTTTMDAYTGMTHVCILVYPDGKYRLKRTFQSTQGGKAEPKVYLDQLPDANLKQLQTTIEDLGFQSTKTTERHGGIIQDMDMLTVTVPREHEMQNISFENAAQRKSYDKTQKPFVNWMKEVQKRKIQPAKEEAPNNCTAPRVLYRTEMRESQMPDEPQH